MRSSVVRRNNQPFSSKVSNFVVAVRFEKAIHQELVGRKILRTELDGTASFRDCTLLVGRLYTNSQIQVRTRTSRIQFNRTFGGLNGLLVVAQPV